jgi:hypothetical protein
VHRGSDISLRLVEEPPPQGAGPVLFESGGAWRVERHGRGLLYSFRGGRGPAYKAALVDTGLREGRLYFPRSPGVRRPRYALDYPLDELLFQHRLVREGCLEVHACAVKIGARVAVMPGMSGAGKSTTARLWARREPETLVLSDDRVVLQPRGRHVTVWGTPWHGMGRFASPGSGQLAGLFFLRHARRTRLLPLSTANAAGRLLARGFPPQWDARLMARALATCERVVRGIPVWELRFRPDRSVVDAVQDALGA